MKGSSVLDAARRWRDAVGALRGPQLVLVALSLALLVLPLAIHKPGLPPTLKADEPSYFLAALSLVHDFDLRVDEDDQRRLFEAYPYLSADNFIIMSSDGWQTLYYGKPYLAPFLAAPFVAVFGAEGAVVFNSLLFVAMLAMGFAWLRRSNKDWLAAFFVVGFWLLSTTWSYVFWIHPEILCAFATCACLFFGFAALEHLGSAASGKSWPLIERLGAHKSLALSAGCLALGVYNKPMLAAIGVPVCIELMLARRFRGLLVWLIGAVVSMIAICSVSWALTGAATPYLVTDRGGFPLHNPSQPAISQEFMESREVVKPADQDPTDASKARDAVDGSLPTAGWWWLFRMPETKWFELQEDIVYFFVGRHTGLFLYMPFALLSLLLFLSFERTRRGWLLVLGIATVAMIFLVWIPFNWHGGGGFVGNRYFLMVYPAFLFLVGRIRPAASVAAFWAAGGWLVGPLVLAPFGLAVPSPTLQWHVRNQAFQPFPIEFSLRAVPGYTGAVQSETWVWGRKDQLRVLENGEIDRAWLRGGGRLDLWLYRSAPLERAALEMKAPFDGQVAIVNLGGVEQRTTLGTEWTRLDFDQPRVYKLRRERSTTAYLEFGNIWIYRLQVDLERGRFPAWDEKAGPYFYLGAELNFLGDTSGVAQSP